MNLPPSIQALFANYAPGAVDAERHRGLVIRTVLAHGDWEGVMWLFEHYGEAAVGDVFRRDYDGLRTLPRPTLCLWGLLFADDEDLGKPPLHSELPVRRPHR